MSEAYDICDYCNEPFLIDDGFEMASQTKLKCSSCATPKKKAGVFNYNALQKQYQVYRAMNAAVTFGGFTEKDFQDKEKIRQFIKSFKRIEQTMRDYWEEQ